MTGTNSPPPPGEQLAQYVVRQIRDGIAPVINVETKTDTELCWTDRFGRRTRLTAQARPMPDGSIQVAIDLCRHWDEPGAKVLARWAIYQPPRKRRQLQMARYDTCPPNGKQPRPVKLDRMPRDEVITRLALSANGPQQIFWVGTENVIGIARAWTA